MLDGETLLTSRHETIPFEELKQYLPDAAEEKYQTRIKAGEAEYVLTCENVKQEDTSDYFQVVSVRAVSYTHLDVYKRQVLEGVAFGLRASLEVARSLGIRIERSKICGGGAKSPLWKKILAAVLNLKLDLIESEEGPGYGGAILAAVGCGEYESVQAACEKLVHVVDTVEPDPVLVEKYEARYQEFRKLYPAVKEFF